MEFDDQLLNKQEQEAPQFEHPSLLPPLPDLRPPLVEEPALDLPPLPDLPPILSPPRPAKMAPRRPPKLKMNSLQRCRMRLLDESFKNATATLLVAEEMKRHAAVMAANEGRLCTIYAYLTELQASCKRSAVLEQGACRMFIFTVRL